MIVTTFCNREARSAFRRIEMRPTSPRDNAAHRVAGDAEISRDVDLAVAFGRSRPNLAHLVRVEFLVTEDVVATLANGIEDVVALRPYPQMGRIDAPWRVAVVDHHEAARDRLLMGVFPREHMGPDPENAGVVRADDEMDVPAMERPTWHQPASARMTVGALKPFSQNGPLRGRELIEVARAEWR